MYLLVFPLSNINNWVLRKQRNKNQTKTKVLCVFLKNTLLPKIFLIIWRGSKDITPMSGNRLNNSKRNVTLSFWRAPPDLQNKREKGIFVAFFWKCHTRISLYTASVSAWESRSRPTRCFTHAMLPIHTCFPGADYKCPERKNAWEFLTKLWYEALWESQLSWRSSQKQFNLPLSYTSLKEIVELNKNASFLHIFKENSWVE